MILEAFAAALVCLDPGHGTLARIGPQLEPIGPGTRLPGVTVARQDLEPVHDGWRIGPTIGLGSFTLN